MHLGSINETEVIDDLALGAVAAGRTDGDLATEPGTLNAHDSVAQSQAALQARLNVVDRRRAVEYQALIAASSPEVLAGFDLVPRGVRSAVQTVQPPAPTVQPPASTVQPPASTVQPPAPATQPEEEPQAVLGGHDWNDRWDRPREWPERWAGWSWAGWSYSTKGDREWQGWQDDTQSWAPDYDATSDGVAGSVGQPAASEIAFPTQAVRVKPPPPVMFKAPPPPPQATQHPPQHQAKGKPPPPPQADM